MLNSVGLGESLLKMIERRQRMDIYTAYGGMVRVKDCGGHAACGQGHAERRIMHGCRCFAPYNNHTATCAVAVEVIVLYPCPYAARSCSSCWSSARWCGGRGSSASKVVSFGSAGLVEGRFEA